MPALLDPRFELPAEPAFAPGTSPFRCAGVLYQSLSAFIQAEVPGRLPRVLQEVKDPLLRRYFEQSFGVASFYDVLPIPYLGVAAARARGVSFEQQIKDSNRFAARSRFAEIYGALIRHVDAETLALALPRAVKILQAFGGCTTEAVGPGRVRGVRTGVPAVLVRWYTASTSAFLSQSLERSTGAPLLIRFSDPEVDGEVARMTTYKLPFEILLGTPRS